MCFAIFSWPHPYLGEEEGRKVVLVGDAEAVSDFAYGHVGVFQENLGGCDFERNEIFVGSDGVMFFEDANDVGF